MTRDPPRARSARFDAAYFRRHYTDPRTRVTTPLEMRGRAALILAAMRQAGLPVHSILDAGCGVGWLRAPFAELVPRASYTGLEYSEYLCRRYGWIQGSAVDYAPARRFDLVVCYDVLQYLEERAAARALANLARLARYGLYLSALTLEDWRENCEQSLTDGEVHLRPAEWYRRRLARTCRHLGFGIWAPKSVRPILWELERPANSTSGARGPSRPAPDARARPRRSRPAGR
ncbi:MAG: class I SAM-dependent methyltransferase [Gammaproteobacteria bacterium]|nr:class I SAM-dependent methyltransferase [Gammaproteobacteria bacterium]